MKNITQKSLKASLDYYISQENDINNNQLYLLKFKQKEVIKRIFNDYNSQYIKKEDIPFFFKTYIKLCMWSSDFVIFTELMCFTGFDYIKIDYTIFINCVDNREIHTFLPSIFNTLKQNNDLVYYKNILKKMNYKV